MTAHTYGPAFDPTLDGPRLKKQHEAIRDYMLARGDWKTLFELREALKYSEASISAQLRHLRKPRFGSYQVEKRRRREGGTWEYRVLPPKPAIARSLFEQPDNANTAVPKTLAPVPPQAIDFMGAREAQSAVPETHVFDD